MDIQCKNKKDIDCLEKWIPLKVVENNYGVSFCPICKGSVWQNRDESNYCFRCGQKLSWS